MQKILGIAIVGKGNMPYANNLEEFSIQLENITNYLRSWPARLEFYTQNYSSVEPLTPHMIFPSVEQYRAKIEKMAIARDKATKLLNSIRFVYYSDNSLEMNDFNIIEAESLVKSYLEKLRKIASDCLYLPESCANPPDLPVIKLPQRKPL